MLKNLLLSAAMACAISPAAANPMEGIVTVDVMRGWEMQSGNRIAALRISLAPGWKTYWRAPGDAGIPPIISFGGSENIAATRLQWPVPEIFYEGNMRSLGYLGDVVVPVELTPRSADGPMILTGEMQIGVCDEICIPAHLTFRANIPAGGERVPAIVAALINRPLTAEEAGVMSVVCAFQPKDDGIIVQTTVTLPHTGGAEAVVIEAGDPEVWVSEPDVSRDGNRLHAVSYMVHSRGSSFALDRSAIRITVLGQNHAVDVRGCDSAG